MSWIIKNSETGTIESPDFESEEFVRGYAYALNAEYQTNVYRVVEWNEDDE